MSDLSRLDGKVALVTGAAQGLGEATARLLAARGVAGLVLTDRNAARGEAVAKSLGGIAKFVPADLQDLADLRKLVPATEAAFGRIDILCNVAGTTERGTILNTDPALYDRILAVNLRAPFFLMQDAANLMRKTSNAGAIVNVASVNAHVGSAILCAYSASKAALVNLTRNSASALAWDRIRVNAILPGWADTPAEDTIQRSEHGATDDWVREAGKKLPFGRLIGADELARAIAYLASAESGLMTGAVVDFDQVSALTGPLPRA